MKQQTQIFWISTAIALTAASILAIVWAAEIAGLAPCPLCLQQRYAYYIAAALAACAAMCAFRLPLNAQGLLFVIAIIFALNAAFGVYHAGVEYGWWAGPVGCSGDISDITSTQDLLSRMHNPIVSCTTPAFRFLSLSLAGYNALASAGLAALAFYGAKK